jgi:hypothetical protein
MTSQKRHAAEDSFQSPTRMTRMRHAFAILFWVLTAAALATPAARADGPYVVRNAVGELESWSIETDHGSARKSGPLAIGSSIAIPAVEGLPTFEVTLRAPAKPAASSLIVLAKTPLFVVADTHGEFASFARMLETHRVVDARLRWSFGRGHLVILGDVFDRGPNHTEILWLLYQLEAEAAKAGGGVQLVLGNHETMVMMGDLRYLHPKYVETARIFGVEYYRLFDAQSVLGQWLRSKPAVLRINRQLFLHAGISRALVEHKLTLAAINTTIRKTLAGSLTDPERDLAGFLMTTDGPLWYRGFFAEQKDFTTATSTDVDAALKHFDVDRIFVGHTIVPTVTPLFDGRVVALNVPAKPDAAGGGFEALLLRGGEMRRARLDGSVEPL